MHPPAGNPRGDEQRGATDVLLRSAASLGEVPGEDRGRRQGVSSSATEDIRLGCEGRSRCWL